MRIRYEGFGGRLWSSRGGKGTCRGRDKARRLCCELLQAKNWQSPNVFAQNQTCKSISRMPTFSVSRIYPRTSNPARGNVLRAKRKVRVRFVGETLRHCSYLILWYRTCGFERKAPIIPRVRTSGVSCEGAESTMVPLIRSSR